MSQKFSIVEDHRLFAQALAGLIVQVGDYVLHDIYSDSETAKRELLAHPPDLVFLDLVMPDGNGLDLLVQLREAEFQVPVIVVSMLKDSLVISKAMDAGAMGFIPKNTDFEELEQAMAAVLSGKVYLSTSLQQEIQQLSEHHNADWESRNLDEKVNQLSKRELEIVKLVAHGYTNAEIGEQLFLSSLTVKTHRHNILKKLGLRNSAALVKLATELGWI
ncbi:MAG: response regulator transcription factor [Bacteroidetes bacterium]|nr:MAG: response regulator transcription factor [Bacteroidota bacterium]